MAIRLTGILITLLLLGAACLPGHSAPAASTAAASTTPQEADGDPGKKAFQDSMDEASTALRTIRRSRFKVDARDQNLKALQDLEMALLKSKANLEAIDMSEEAKGRFGTDTKAYRTAFRRDLVKAMMIALEIEDAVLSDNPTAANAAAKKLLELRNTAHDLFEG